MLLCVIVVKPQTLKASAKQTFSRRAKNNVKVKLAIENTADSRQQLICSTTVFS